MFLSVRRPIFSLLRFFPQFFRRFVSLPFSRTLSMADSKMLDDVDSDDIPHAFLCCVCLDLLYKPIVLSCGHISCFWCVHKSMNGFRESHCPICRRPYYHFPTICEMLHLLILKMYPMAYKRRQNQTLEEERKLGLFSPQYDSLACGSRAGEKIEHLEDSANGEMNANTKNDNVVAELILEENSEVVRSASVEILNSLGDLHGQNTQNQETVTVADVLCRACTQLLLRPVVLNCGHAFCESCINLRVETLECQVCQSLQPRGFPNVCLELDQFLKEQLPEEYKLRSDSVQLKLAETFKHESPTSCSSEGGKKGQGLPRWDEVASKVHPAVGCDSCGMYPIIGDRYKCEDCFEEVGFDLCGECYNTRSKRPGRFNQQHRPEHKFKLVLPTMFSTMRSRIVTEIMLEEGSTTFIIANDEGSESSEDIGAILELSSDARESEEDNSDVDVRTQTNSNDSRTDQNMSRPT
ncbi:E3 ubiquitin-protein ligase PRT1 [Cucurbita pepo subsp. pepo]|uniref:E3 ubiquitin-protein ligase PRT1 n=1 Tax=Cucurbita pepo subsp. pepo TaxID=3664 RepID=UPI000C9D935E|nr:E3 ubiquitin-protein ligase PRT1 [Cucurbita pepo subsp. pepo]